MSLYKLKVAMMIVMCAHVSRSQRGRLAREGHTMPERRAHEPVPVAREHMSLTVHRANTMPERRAHEPVPVAREHLSLTVYTEPIPCRNGELTSPSRCLKILYYFALV